MITEIKYVEIVFSNNTKLRIDPKAQQAEWITELGGLITVVGPISLEETIKQLEAVKNDPSPKP